MSEDNRTIDQLLDDVRESLRIADMAHDDFVVNNDDVRSLVVAVEFLRLNLAEAAEALRKAGEGMDSLAADTKAIMAEYVPDPGPRDDR